jgi:hypothetical protein
MHSATICMVLLNNKLRRMTIMSTILRSHLDWLSHSDDHHYNTTQRTMSQQQQKNEASFDEMLNHIQQQQISIQPLQAASTRSISISPSNSIELQQQFASMSLSQRLLAKQEQQRKWRERHHQQTQQREYQSRSLHSSSADSINQQDPPLSILSIGLRDATNHEISNKSSSASSHHQRNDKQHASNDHPQQTSSIATSNTAASQTSKPTHNFITLSDDDDDNNSDQENRHNAQSVNRSARRELTLLERLERKQREQRHGQMQSSRQEIQIHD